MTALTWFLSTEVASIQSLLLGVAVFLLVKWWLSERSLSRYNLPPGPWAFPVIGNLPQLVCVKEYSRALTELSEKYGDIYRLRVGPFHMVVVCGLEHLKEGLIKKGEVFNGRPNWIFLINKIFKDGVMFNTGHVWKDMRRFTVSALRDFGMGKSKMEDKIQEEISEMSKVIESHQGKPFELRKIMAEGVMNVIYSIVFGNRMDYNDPEFEKLIGILDYVFKNAGMQVAENFLPWLYYIRWDSPTKRMIKNDKVLRAHAEKKIEEHRETFDANNIRDFIDMYILFTKEEKTHSFTDANVFRTIVDLFSAGSDTSAMSLNWAFLYMANYPDVQEQCRKELRNLTDLNRSVKMSDREDLPFVNATILEVQRISTVVPGSVPHVAEKDSTIGGYDIPKGTIVQFMFDGVHNDPRYWKEPRVFNPNRWLTEDKKIIKHEAYLPFSWGPRSCLGEPLAKMEIFLFFSNLLQKFAFTSSEEDPVNLIGQVTGITFQPYRTIICAKPI